MAYYLMALSKKKQRIAEEARKAASEIIQDAIDKECYGLPVTYYYTCSEPVDPYTFCCIPTKKFLQNLLAELSKARFIEDTDPEMYEVFAYVTPDNKDDIIYLCEEFWKAKDTLCKDSKPGTLIHEVSHLLGTEDMFYEHMTVELYEEYETLLGKSKCVTDLDGKEHWEEVFQVNANSIEHEFETIINHEGAYSDGSYQCCGETKKNSVCTERSRGHYRLHENASFYRDEMQRKVERFWQEASARLNQGEKIQYVKKKNQACKKIPVSDSLLHTMSNFIKVLSEEKQRIAEEARKAASEIIQDAIDKKCYGLPVPFHYTCSEPVDPYTFCCIPTKEFLQDLLAKLSNARFMENTDPAESDTFAYVIPQNKDVIIYLCEQFWKAEDTLCEDSKPGTLIHEVSHLLGTEDIFYEHMTVELYEEYGTLLGRSKCGTDLNEKRHREEVFQVNANSIEHEFETIINHERAYSDGKYQCCGETKKNSVCKHRSTGHYYLHERFPVHRDEMQRKLKIFWQEASASLNQKQKLQYVKKKNQACEKIPVSEA